MGACFEVHNRLGCGFTEPVYQECLEIELSHQGIPFVAQGEQRLSYRDRVLQQTFKPDFVCFGKIIIEIKSVEKLIDEHRAQLLNYLHVTQLPLGLLINFAAHPKLEHERLALTRPKTVARE